MNVAVAHEHYPTRGGGEVVADELADCFDAPIVTGWIKDADYSTHDPIELLENSPARVLRPFFTNPLVRDLFYTFGWESAPPLRDYNVIIQSGNAPSWYVPDQNQTIVKYNHSPPRNPFDLFWREESHTAGTLDLFIPGYVVDRLYKKFARQFWKNRTSEIDLWVCNSEVIAHRTQKYLGVDEDRIEVVYPPVDVAQYEPTDDHDGYYVALSRLVPSKRFDLLIKAWDEIDAPLKIVGDGPHKPDLEACAIGNENIEFTGRVSESRKRDLLQNAKASLFAAENEDFGIVPVESFAAGTPVLGVEDGYTQYQVKHGKNGRLFKRNVESVRKCVEVFETKGVQWSADHMHQFAQQFGTDRFCEEMHEMVAKAKERNEIEVNHKEPAVVE